MSNQPNQQFYVGDKVIDTQRKLMGIVTWYEWEPVMHDYTYEYKCTYMTDELEDLRYVVPKSRWSPEFCLQHLGPTPFGLRSLTPPRNGTHMGVIWRQLLATQDLVRKEGRVHEAGPALLAVGGEVLGVYRWR